MLDRTGQKLNTLELQTHPSLFTNPELRTFLSRNRPTNPDPNLEKLNMWTELNSTHHKVIWGSKFQCSRIFISFFGIRPDSIPKMLLLPKLNENIIFVAMNAYGSFSRHKLYFYAIQISVKFFYIILGRFFSFGT